MRLRETESKKELRKVVDQYITEGYKIQSRGNNSVKLKKTEYGSFAAHILIFIVTAWWTFLLGNIFYAAYKYITGEQVLVQLEEEGI
jgi:hypothetical protein